MDLLYGECSLALAHAMSVPVVGFWAASPATGMLHFTTQPSNPSFMPFFVTGFSDRMSFAERFYNAGLWYGGCLLNMVLSDYTFPTPYKKTACTFSSSGHFTTYL